MIRLAFERPPIARSFIVNEYAIIYRISTGVNVVLEYDGEEVTLGSDLTVSRRIPGVREGHMKIFRSGDRYEVMDLCSTNGTWIDGVLLRGRFEDNTCKSSRYELKDGSIVVVGANTVFRVSLNPEIEMLPADAYITVSATVLSEYPIEKAFPIDERNYIIKVVNKPGLYTSSSGVRKSVREQSESMISYTVITLDRALSDMFYNVEIGNSDTCGRLARAIYDILVSNNELSISINREYLNFLRRISDNRDICISDKETIKNIILNIRNDISYRYRLPTFR